MSKTNGTQTKWYLIDNHILGKIDAHGCYIFDNGSWKEDKNSLIMDCLLGYDPTEEGPYVFGNTEIMDRIQEIDVCKAKLFVKKYLHKKIVF